jgi:hypothetical protein
LPELDNAMLDHMTHIVLKEHRSFSYLDFISFEVNEKKYGMKHGTFRNKISILKRYGKIDMICNSGLGFYTLKGQTVPKPMTSYRMGVSSSDPVCQIIRNLPFGKQSLHDIRLTFTLPEIWKILSYNSTFIHPVSKDIQLRRWEFNGLVIRAVIHQTDTVSIMVACSDTPIPIDLPGIILLSESLARVEERINYLIKSVNVRSCGTYKIPNYRQWVVTMWHFGRDGLIEYGGEKFHAAWEIPENILLRAYSKEMRDKKMRVRIERQESVRKTFVEAVQEKLDSRSYLR